MGHAQWLAEVPRRVAELAALWSLDVDAPYQPGGRTAWVAPVRRLTDGAEVVLKVGWAHPESRDEAAGLAEWAGNGAVIVHEAGVFGDTQAMLLERCQPGTSLTARPETEQDEIVADVLRRLWRAPAGGRPFRPLGDMAEQWAAGFERRLADAASAIDAGLARDGLAVFRELPATAADSVLLCTDLHAGNILASEREPWLMIDPKPYVGDPCYDPVQHMLNCEERLLADPRAFVARMADLTSVDETRLRQWVFARCVIESLDWPEAATVARRLAE